MADVQANQVRIAIPWQQWTPEAFRLARERDVPILLSIGAVWCHWCHVMDESTYRDPEVIRRVTAELLPIRVDTDRRPDINSRYNLGGWPSTAFLTPEGDLLTGGTFMPPEEFLATLDEVTGYYRNQRADLETKLERRRARRGRIAELRHRLRGDIKPDIIDTVTQAVLSAYDSRYGGFGDAPKFPLPDTIEFALALGSFGPNEALLDVARTTLTAMAQGGIYDQVGDGFFRYSTTADWTVPHYEKLLDGNARLLSTYLHAAQIFDDPLYQRIGHGIVAFTRARLRDQETGAFMGSVDADEEYYHLRADARALREPPAVDPTLFSDRNAMMISAFLEAAAIFDEPYLADLALEALEAIWRLNFVPDAGMAHFYDGTPQLAGLIGDQVWMGHALLDAQAYMGRGDYQDRAAELLHIMRARLMDPDVGGFYDVPADPAALGRLVDRHKLLEENAHAATLALRLHRLTGQDEYAEIAADTLEALAPLYQPYRHHAAAYGLAVHRFIYPPLHLAVVGHAIQDLSRSLRLTALSVYGANRVVETVDPDRQALRLQQLGLPATPSPALYVRRGRQTSPPVQDPAQVRAAIQGVLA